MKENSAFPPKREIHGVKRPGYEQIKAFAEAYCIPVEFLMNYQNPKNGPQHKCGTTNGKKETHDKED